MICSKNQLRYFILKIRNKIELLFRGKSVTKRKKTDHTTVSYKYQLDKKM